MQINGRDSEAELEFTARSIVLRKKDRAVEIPSRMIATCSLANNVLSISTFHHLHLVTQRDSIPRFRDHSHQLSFSSHDSLTHEYARLNVEDRGWRISFANEKYVLCSSYPKALIVPRNISDTVLKHAARFRTKNRFPVLTYLHSNRASISRSGQPLTGLSRNRSIQDEKLVDSLCVNREKVLLVDARPTANALASTLAGAGIEHLTNYPNCSRMFVRIENIHAVRAAFLEWLDGNSVSWLRLIADVLEGTRKVVEWVTSGGNALIHCSDGWDRTSQLVSLAQVCLDPYYRTLSGFQALIQKDWLSFGHRFELRLSQNGKDQWWRRIIHSDQFSPIFPQFLDCVHQLFVIFPDAFSFSQEFLIELYDECFSNSLGLFSGNCEQERSTESLVWWKGDLAEPRNKEVLRLGKGIADPKEWGELVHRWN